MCKIQWIKIHSETVKFVTKVCLHYWISVNFTWMSVSYNIWVVLDYIFFIPILLVTSSDTKPFNLMRERDSHSGDGEESSLMGHDVVLLCKYQCFGGDCCFFRIVQVDNWPGPTYVNCHLSVSLIGHFLCNHGNIIYSFPSLLASSPPGSNFAILMMMKKKVFRNIGVTLQSYTVMKPRKLSLDYYQLWIRQNT